MGFLAEISANKSGQDGKPRLTKKEHKAIAQRTRALEELVRKQKELQGYYGCYEEATGSLPNHYKVLGIDMSADPSDVKKSYHRVALRCHPDKDALCGHAPMDKMNLVFGVVRNAYDTLSDRQRWATLAFFLAVRSHSNFSLSLSLSSTVLQEGEVRQAAAGPGSWTVQGRARRGLHEWRLCQQLEEQGREEEGEEGDTVLRSGRLPFDVHLLAAVAASQPVALLCLNAFLC